MILKEYRKELFHPKCNSNFQSLHCIARLGQDIRKVLPSLNSSLGGDSCTKEPPSVTFKFLGKLITVEIRILPGSLDFLGQIKTSGFQRKTRTYKLKSQLAPNFLLDRLN